MSKKRLNAEKIQNELSNQSVFFPKQETTEYSSDRTNEPTNERSNVRPLQRTKIRHTFDIFEDQLEAMRQYQLECMQKMRRKPLLGDMVQKALDDYISKLELEK